jgi:hypothetical protein
VVAEGDDYQAMASEEPLVPADEGNMDALPAEDAAEGDDYQAMEMEPELPEPPPLLRRTSTTFQDYR